MYPLAAIAAVAGLTLLAGPGPEIGKPAPAFTLVDAQGNTHSLSDYKGKVVVIEWVNIACPTARFNYQSGHVPRMQKKYKAKGVVWLSIIITEKQLSGDGRDVITPSRADSMARAMVKQFGASPTATLIDVGGAIGAAYATRTSMHMFVVDKNGMLAYDGALDDYSVGRAFARKLYPQFAKFLNDESEKDKSRRGANYVATAVDELLAGKPVTTTKMMPYGCHSAGLYLNGDGTEVGAGSGD